MKGSKRLRPSGAYELRVYGGKDPGTGRERTLTRTFRGGSRAADGALRDFIKEIEDGQFGGTTATLRVLLDKWMAQVRRRRSPTTIREYQRIINKTILPALGDVKIRKLTVSQLDGLYAALEERGLSAASIHQVHSVLRAALKQGVKWGWVPLNIVENASPPPLRRGEVVAPTPAQVQVLLRYAEKDDPQMATLIALAATTGARRGELCALRWTDVDWQARTLTIRRSLSVISRTQRVEKGTKTHANRTVALDELGMGVLVRHRAYTESQAAELGVGAAPDAPIISYDLFAPISPDTATHYVQKAAEACGFRTHLHALRHFSGTQLVGQGVNVRTVAERLGHADPSTTLRVYAHALPEKDREAAAALGGAMSANPSWYDQRVTLHEMQGAKCGVCDRPLTLDRARLDHDHLTGMTRGLLCPGCNQTVDDGRWDGAVAYLDHPPAAGLGWFYVTAQGDQPPIAELLAPVTRDDPPQSPRTP